MSARSDVRDTLRWQDSGGAFVVAADDFDALLAENQHLRQALAQILDEAGAYHGSPNRKDNALHAIAVKARTALDGKPSAAQTLEDMPPAKGTET